jgi:hypothetical protein
MGLLQLHSNLNFDPMRLILPCLLLLSSSLLAQQSKSFDFSHFDRVDISGNFEVSIQPGPFRVTARGEGERFDALKLSLHGHVLIIEEERDWWEALNVLNKEKVYVDITMPAFAGVEASGAGQIQVQGPFTSPLVQIDLSGAADCHATFDTDLLEAEVSGAGNLFLAGSAGRANIELSGAGDLHAYPLSVATLEIEVSGAGTAEVTATESLEAEASGAGTIRYAGSPRSVMTEVSGAGKIIPR